jgi:hypothetical protein
MTLDDERTPDTAMTERKPWRLKPHERLLETRRARSEHNAQVGRKRPDEGDDYGSAAKTDDPIND